MQWIFSYTPYVYSILRLEISCFVIVTQVIVAAKVLLHLHIIMPNI